jgi:hypothetical protein
LRQILQRLPFFWRVFAAAGWLFSFTGEDEALVRSREAPAFFFMAWS